METLDEARELAQRMIAIGQGVGRKVTAVLSEMNQPLGHAIGNSLEVIEAIETLKGRGPDDLREHCLAVASEMLLLGRQRGDADHLRLELEQLLTSGQALERFASWIEAQGGDPDVAQDYAILPTAPVQWLVTSPCSGYLASMDARTFGLVSVEMGAGRRVKEDTIDPGVGIVLHAGVSDYVKDGTPLMTLHARSEQQAKAAAQTLLAACGWSQAPVARPPVIHDILRDPSVAGYQSV